MKERKTISRTPEETRRTAAELIRTMPEITVVALKGELGSGKTCFVQGMAEALNIEIPVTSPTFTLINEYAGMRPLYHFDLYRISNPDELLSLGFEDYLASEGIVAIEWPEKAAGLLPPETIYVDLKTLDQPGERSILIRKDR